MSTDIITDEQIVADERYGLAPHLTVVDGFRFGCGLILAVVAFCFILIIVVATVLLVAMLLNFPLPLGIPPAASAGWTG